MGEEPRIVGAAQLDPGWLEGVLTRIGLKDEMETEALLLPQGDAAREAGELIRNGEPLQPSSALGKMVKLPPSLPTWGDSG